MHILQNKLEEIELPQDSLKQLKKKDEKKCMAHTNLSMGLRF